MPDFVAYYRVSTDRQGTSGLGLDGQRAAVLRYVQDPASIIASFTEIESGKRVRNRPQLAAALEKARRTRATLVIASLDRLARNVHFISGLMEQGVPFIAADFPNSEPFALHVYAAMAEQEGRKISQRTRIALAEAKKRGVRLGNPDWQKTLHLARAKRHPMKPSPKIIEIMHEQRAAGKSYRAIAAHLNDLDLRTPRGARWHNETIRDILNRHPQEQPQ